jgi:hypothetical protein
MEKLEKAKECVEDESIRKRRGESGNKDWDSLLQISKME